MAPSATGRSRFPQSTGARCLWLRPPDLYLSQPHDYVSYNLLRDVVVIPKVERWAPPPRLGSEFNRVKRYRTSLLFRRNEFAVFANTVCSKFLISAFARELPVFYLVFGEGSSTPGWPSVPISVLTFDFPSSRILRGE